MGSAGERLLRESGTWMREKSIRLGSARSHGAAQSVAANAGLRSNASGGTASVSRRRPQRALGRCHVTVAVVS